MPNGTNPLAGTARQDYVPVGPVTVGFEPEDGAAERVAELSTKIESDLADLKEQIAHAVIHWSRPWAAAPDWGAKIALLREARQRGLHQGARAWGNDQVSFFHEVGHALYEGAQSTWDWYSDQSLIDQVFPLQAAERQLATQTAQEIDHLWNEREKILGLFKNLRDQSVNGIETAIDALEEAPGQIGRIMAMLKDKGAAWVHGLIEACRQSDAINHVFATVGTILYSIVPPTVWVEGIATAAGYIIPEILLAILLVVIGAITEGADAGAIATQIGRFMATIEETFGKLGELGKVLRAVKDGIKAIGEKIAKLVRAALANIEEKVEGAANTFNPILRHVSRRAERRRTAQNFMQDSGMSKDEIDGHTSGIDFSNPVKVRSLEKGERVEQWNYRKPDGSFAQGEYYTTPGSNKNTLGIRHERENYFTKETEWREKRIFEASEPENVLDSTARNKVWKNEVTGEIESAKGGGRQIFTKSTDAFKEVPDE